MFSLEQTYLKTFFRFSKRAIYFDAARTAARTRTAEMASDTRTFMTYTYAFPPRSMSSRTAAYYLDVSVTKLRALPIPRQIHGGNVRYDINDLNDYADNLPYESADHSPHENNIHQLKSDDADRAFELAS